ncbi:MAG: diguanylate cyclase [Eubacterium sp.]|nr:diguanylate cyclase [Eubacterium sp.]
MKEYENMIIDSETNNLVAETLAGHFECVYLIDIESNNYIVFSGGETVKDTEYPDGGEDFFADAVKNADLFIHPDDVEMMISIYSKEKMLMKLSENGVFSVIFRAGVDGKLLHMRHIYIMCKDKKHIVCCLENIEEEIMKNKANERALQSAKRMARLDALTGVRNRNAFREFVSSIDSEIESKGNHSPFGIVMFDINNLKLLNDTRGHSFGDEIIQRASRMICDIYKHSPIFRVGGDEFVAFLSGQDYQRREELLKKVEAESLANRRARSGPIVASGMAVFDPKIDKKVDSIYERADKIMYENKKELKAMALKDGFANMEKINAPISDERKRLLDGLFDAMYTIAGEGYVYLNDMKYDFSRWSLSLIDDFGLESEYMYHADKIWQDYIHPDDMDAYREMIDAVLGSNAEVRPFIYRARAKDGKYVFLTTRGFVLSDKEGNPDYFGGIIIKK